MVGQKIIMIALSEMLNIYNVKCKVYVNKYLCTNSELTLFIKYKIIRIFNL